MTGDILIFNGAPVLPEGYTGTGEFGLDASMNHNSATGQITGTANFTADLSELAAGALPLSSSFDMTGNMKFSAKVTRTGAVTRLVGAKATVTMSAMMSDGLDRLNATGSLQVNFRKYEVDTSQSPVRLDAVASVSNFKMKISGVVMRQKFSQSFNQSQLVGRGVDLFEDISVSTEFPEENFAGVAISFRNLTTNSKGGVAGVANSILDTQNFPAAAYKLSGKQDLRTGVSQISLAGQLAGSRGTSAVLFVDDDLQVQSGPKMRNVVKAYGYTISF